jgi:hypothetical protein
LSGNERRFRSPRNIGGKPTAQATQRRVRRAAELKSLHAIAYADAFAVATALEFQATLMEPAPAFRASALGRPFRAG